MLAKLTKDQLNQSATKIDIRKTQPDPKAAAVSDAKIKEIEEKIKNMQIRFQKDIDKLQSLATLGAGGGDENAGASAKLMEMTVKKIEDKHVAHAKRMNQIDIKVQNALTDIQGLTENFKNKQQKIFKDMLKIGNLKNEINIKVDSFADTLQQLAENLTESTNKTE